MSVVTCLSKELREKFIFKLVPMLNPDGVIVGNNRCSLTGRDLNRQYRTVIRETYPPVWHTKLMIRRLIEECGIEMYCDLHAHSRKHNTFIYGCENKRYLERRLQEQVFPLMLHKNAADKFSFEDCKFRIQRSKEGTGRVVVWMMGVANSYTMETSFGGSTLGGRSDTHFCTQDYEMMGRYFCETLLDYCDMEPAKERLRNKIINRLLKEGSNADEPTNINLSDYTSDEGDTSSCSDEEKPEKNAGGGVDDFDCCPPLRVPPPSPVLPKREHHKALLHRNIKSCNLEKSPPPVRKVLQVHRTNIDLQTTDPGSDLATEFESGDDSSWRQSLKRNKMAESCVRGVKCGEQCSMPPELIVTPAQVPTLNDQTCNVPVMEETNKEEMVATPQLLPEPRAPEKIRNHSWHHIRCQSFTRLQSRVVSQTLDDLSNEVQVKLGLSLRQKLWTGVPCTCHSYTVDTLWSNSTLSYNSEEALLVSCSQKLQALQNSLDKPSKKKVLARKHLSPRHCPVPRPVSTDSSPEEDETDRSSNINNKTRKKSKFKKTKSVNSSASVKDEAGRKANRMDTQKPSKLQSNIPIGKTGQHKQSLKWKFRKSGIVATAVSAIRNLSEHTETASETEASDKQKAVTKKKKKRKTITNVPKKRVPSSNSKQSPKKNFKLLSS
uniref:Peptidase M14 domain-containing protein n=1 Tax=Timema genevievae TaxID=629358 RepID=A0A7R9K430_TIMGE|nr:unnamed protein product [Timema genevievae]